MPRMLNARWVQTMKDKVQSQLLPGMYDFEVDEVLSSNLAAKFLIKLLAAEGRPYKVHQLGAGVKHITTNTDTCPCCKRKL